MFLPWLRGFPQGEPYSIVLKGPPRVPGWTIGCHCGPSISFLADPDYDTKTLSDTDHPGICVKQPYDYAQKLGKRCERCFTDSDCEGRQDEKTRCDTVARASKVEGKGADKPPSVFKLSSFRN